MRNFDECKAEVFRRSEARIKQRKKRTKHIAVLCLPLVLCIGVCSWAFLNGLMATKNDFAMPESAGFDQNSQLTDKNYSYNGAEAPQNPENAQQFPQIILHANGNSYTVCNIYSKTIVDILESLDYAPERVCRCLPQHRVETENGNYGIHLGEGYARCSDGQAKLTADQLATLRKIIGWILEQPADGIG